MQALQLIDEQHQMVAQDALSMHNSLPQVVVGTPDNQRLSPDDIHNENPMLKANSRWRHPSALAINNDEIMANCMSLIAYIM